MTRRVAQRRTRRVASAWQKEHGMQAKHSEAPLVSAVCPQHEVEHRVWARGHAMQAGVAAPAHKQPKHMQAPCQPNSTLTICQAFAKMQCIVARAHARAGARGCCNSMRPGSLDTRRPLAKQSHMLRSSIGPSKPSFTHRSGSVVACTNLPKWQSSPCSSGTYC